MRITIVVVIVALLLLRTTVIIMAMVMIKSQSPHQQPNPNLAVLCHTKRVPLCPCDIHSDIVHLHLEGTSPPHLRLTRALSTSNT